MDEAVRNEYGQPDISRGTGDAGWSGRTADSGQGGDNSTMDQAKEQLGQAREQLNEGMDKAKDQVDAGIDTGATQLEGAADKVRDAVGDKEGMPREVGLKVADTMDTASTYLKEHSSDEIMKDLESYVKEHPAQAMVGAIFAGFLVGRILR
jgi:ElaB/YqjD/DUF883 family membrane-anchored ribosome-binding protein